MKVWETRGGGRNNRYRPLSLRGSERTLLTHPVLVFKSGVKVMYRGQFRYPKENSALLGVRLENGK